MSQVIVTDDKLKVKREKSRLQERQISREEEFDHWRRSDVTKMDPFERLVGYAVAPVVALWGLFGAIIYVAFSAIKAVFRVLGKAIGGTKILK